MKQPDEPLYAGRLYDLFQSGRDYPAEVATLKDLARRHRPSSATWLDVARGTGHHLAGLKQSFDVAGVDLSAAMLAMARRNAGPEVPLHEANFTTFDLGQTFDVVSCLTSSICHAETAAALTSAVVRMTAHVEADGLLLLERYFSPEEWDDSRVSAHHVDRPNLRASQHHVSRQDGAAADLHVHYVLAEPGTVTHHEEHFRVGLFNDGDYSKAFEAAGVTHRQLIQNLLSGRGLYLASRAPLRP